MWTIIVWSLRPLTKLLDLTFWEWDHAGYIRTTSSSPEFRLKSVIMALSSATTITHLLIVEGFCSTPSSRLYHFHHNGECKARTCSTRWQTLLAHVTKARKQCLNPGVSCRQILNPTTFSQHASTHNWHWIVEILKCYIWNVQIHPYPDWQFAET